MEVLSTSTVRIVVLDHLLQRSQTFMTGYFCWRSLLRLLLELPGLLKPMSCCKASFILRHLADIVERLTYTSHSCDCLSSPSTRAIFVISCCYRRALNGIVHLISCTTSRSFSIERLVILYLIQIAIQGFNIHVSCRQPSSLRN